MAAAAVAKTAAKLMEVEVASAHESGAQRTPNGEQRVAMSATKESPLTAMKTNSAAWLTRRAPKEGAHQREHPAFGPAPLGLRVSHGCAV